MSKQFKFNANKVGKFLKSVTSAEYIYLQNCMMMRDNIQNLIKRHKLTKEDFCQRLQIDAEIYEDYIVGNYNYAMDDMACLNAAFIELEAQKLKEDVPVKVVAPNKN